MSKVGISKFEHVLFKFSRAASALVSAVAVAGIVVCMMVLLGLFDAKTTVRYPEVTEKIESSGTKGNKTSRPPTTAYTVPPNVAKYMHGDNERLLSQWTQNLEPAQKQEFVDNLSDMIGEGEANRQSIVDVINSYQEIKTSKIDRAMANQYVALAQKVTAAIAILGLLVLLVVVSLVLVMLAVERHLRVALQPSSGS